MQRGVVHRQTAGQLGHQTRHFKYSPICKASQGSDGPQTSLGPLGLAVMVTLASTLATQPLSAPLARAEEEVELTPLQKRQQESERRRDLLRQARERAEQKRQEAEASAVATTTEADKAVDTDTESIPSKLNTKLYETEAAKALKPPAPNPLENSPFNFSLPPPPESLPEIKVPDFKGFKLEAPKLQVPKFNAPNFEAPKLDLPKLEVPKFEMPKLEEPKLDSPKFEVPRLEVPKLDLPKFDAPKFNFDLPKLPVPEAAEPAPAPKQATPTPTVTPTPRLVAPLTVPAPDPKKATTSTPEVVKTGKRRGPLPLAAAQLLVLGLYVGLGLLATRFHAQASEAIQVVGKVTSDVYKQVETQLSDNK